MCLLAVGCGSVSAGLVGQRAPVQARRVSGSTETGNRRLARTEAARLLALAPLPAHAVRLRLAPRVLSMPAMGRPGVASLVDESRSWRIDMPFTAAYAWLAAHRPAGLQQDGSAGPANPLTAGYGYAGPRNPAWSSAELDVEVAPAGRGTSVLRADGLVQWLDPVPVQDTAVGKRLRVLVTARCPASDARVVGVRNPGANLTHALLPDSRPSAGLLCRYHGMNGAPFRLRTQRRLSAAQAGRLAATMARTPISHPIGAVYVCPMGDGTAELIALAYPGRADVDLWVRLNGCGGVTNGYIEAGYLLP